MIMPVQAHNPHTSQAAVDITVLKMYIYNYMQYGDYLFSSGQRNRGSLALIACNSNTNLITETLLTVRKLVYLLGNP